MYGKHHQVKCFLHLIFFGQGACKMGCINVWFCKSVLILSTACIDKMNYWNIDSICFKYRLKIILMVFCIFYIFWTSKKTIKLVYRYDLHVFYAFIFQDIVIATGIIAILYPFQLFLLQVPWTSEMSVLYWRRDNGWRVQYTENGPG